MHELRHVNQILDFGDGWSERPETELEAEQFENDYLHDSDCAGPCGLFRECDKQD